MKFISTNGLLIALALALSSCAKLFSVESHNVEQAYGKACPNPTYVATIAKDADTVIKHGGPDTTYKWNSLRLAALVKEAQTKYGADVTIENVRWDLEKGRRRSVVYDVVNCK